MANRKRKTHQQSSIDLLPDDIRQKLEALLRDRRVRQLDATRRINAILAEQKAAGALPDDSPEKISKSAVNRYFGKMEEVGAKIRETREVAKMWIGELGSEPQGDVGKLLNEMVRGLAFRAAMRASEADDDEPIDPKLLKSLAVSVYRLERAAKENADLEEKIRKQASLKAAKAVETEAKRQGASAATIDSLRAAIMQELGS